MNNNSKQKHPDGCIQCEQERAQFANDVSAINSAIHGRMMQIRVSLTKYENELRTLLQLQQSQSFIYQVVCQQQSNPEQPTQYENTQQSNRNQVVMITPENEPRPNIKHEHQPPQIQQHIPLQTKQEHHNQVPQQPQFQQQSHPQPPPQQKPTQLITPPISNSKQQQEVEVEDDDDFFGVKRERDSSYFDQQLDFHTLPSQNKNPEHLFLHNSSQQTVYQHLHQAPNHHQNELWSNYFSQEPEHLNISPAAQDPPRNLEKECVSSSKVFKQEIPYSNNNQHLSPIISHHYMSRSIKNIDNEQDGEEGDVVKVRAVDREVREVREVRDTGRADGAGQHVESKLLEWAQSKVGVGLGHFRVKAQEFNRGVAVSKPWVEKVYRKMQQIEQLNVEQQQLNNQNYKPVFRVHRGESYSSPQRIKISPQENIAKSIDFRQLMNTSQQQILGDNSEDDLIYSDSEPATTSIYP